MSESPESKDKSAEPPVTGWRGSRLVRSMCEHVEFKDVRAEKDGLRFTAVASTGNGDRDGESIEPKGWVLPKASVPLFFGHAGYRSAENWIGVVERAEISDDALTLHNWIPEVRHNEVGAKMADFIQRGIPVPGSVGFDPLAWTNRDGSKGQRNRGEGFPGGSPGRRYTSQELLEFSLVPVPSNVDSRVLEFAKALELLGVDEGRLAGVRGPFIPQRGVANRPPEGAALTPFEQVCVSLGIPVRRRGVYERLVELRDLLDEIVEQSA